MTVDLDENYNLTNGAVPLTLSKSKHLYAELSFTAEVPFTRAHLHNSPCTFFLPSTQKLVGLVMCASPKHSKPENIRVLKDFSKRRSPGHRVEREPNCFRVSLETEDARFNDSITTDVMTLDRLPVLNIVNDETHLSVARFRLDEFTSTV